MGDKEPRRRKKRRDSQKKDDVRSDDHFFVPPKSESRDSDQDAEEDIVIHSHHQPSNLAKFVFVILFSGLVLSLSFIFISLRDTDKGPVDIFDVSQEDHGEALHDEHIEEALHDDHHHDQEESEVRLEDFISGLSSVFSQSTEQVKESEEAIPSEDTLVTEDKETIDLTSIESESSTDQGILEEYVEDISEQLPPESIEKPTSSAVYPDTSTPYSEDIYSTFDYTESEDFSMPTVQPDEFEPPLQTFREAANPLDEDDDDDNEQDSFSIYEKVDITNEADFEIKEQLDEINEMLDKESIDDNDDDEDEDDDDDEEEEDDVEEEFDFWQF